MLDRSYHTKLWLAGQFTKEMAQEYNKMVERRRAALDERFAKHLFPQSESSDDFRYDWEKDLH